MPGYWNDCFPGDYSREPLTEKQIKENIKKQKIIKLEQLIKDSKKELEELRKDYEESI